jgi:surface polysaccharide O-acyltransferase-like enzyme
MHLKKHTESIQPKRKLWADVIRIIAIYFVVQYHISFPPASPSLFSSIYFILEGLARTCVPLFFMLSGALLLGKNEDFKTFFRKRSLKVLVPWIAWTIIYMLYHLTIAPGRSSYWTEFFAHTQRSFLLEWLHYASHTFLTVLWFFPIIFILYLLTPLLQKLIKKFSATFLFGSIALWFVFISVIPYLHFGTVYYTDEITFRTVSQYFGYYLLGYALVKYKMPTWLVVSLPILLVIGLFPLVLSSLPINHIYLQNFSVGYVGPGAIVGSIAFFYLLYLLCNRYESTFNQKSKKLLALISGASLGVYIIHWIVIEQLGPFLSNLLQIGNAQYFITLLIFFISVSLVIIMQKIHLIKAILP